MVEENKAHQPETQGPAPQHTATRSSALPGWLGAGLLGMGLLGVGLLGVGLCGVGLLAASHASAQLEPPAERVHLNQYRSAETIDDGFAISRPTDRGHLRFGARLDVDYANNPLVYENRLGDASSETASIVEHQLTGQLNLSLGLFERAVIFAGLPVNFLMAGSDSLPAGTPRADGTTVGDPYFGFRMRIFGEPEEIFAMALQLAVTAPLAAAADGGSHFSGEEGATITPELLFELRPISMLRITGNLGARLRAQQPVQIINLRVYHELTFGLGVTVDAVPDLLAVYLEAYGASTFETFGQDDARESTPFEALLGARVRPIAETNLQVGLAGAVGLQRGYGTPDARVILTIGWADGPIRDPEPEDRDGDGLNDDVDECPDEPEDMDEFEDENGCPDPDNDNDGVLDADEGEDEDGSCMNRPETANEWHDEDGCPDEIPDTDGDGLLDNVDQCPNEPEDVDSFEDDNGCPDPDNDQDGVLDVNEGTNADGESCVNIAEDRDGIQDDDGCPETDADTDQIIDPEDRCPLDPGQPDAEHPERNGCPRAIQVDREAGTILILQRVEFATNRDVILDASLPTLNEVRNVLRANPQLRVIRIEGHTDDRGNDDRNMDLSRRRARSVMRYLMQNEIPDSRLRGFGCGELHPRAENRSAAGRQENRRVEFHIIEPAPAQGARTLEGCQEVTREELTAEPEPAPAPRRGRPAAANP